MKKTTVTRADAIKRLAEIAKATLCENAIYAGGSLVLSAFSIWIATKLPVTSPVAGILLSLVGTMPLLLFVCWMIVNARWLLAIRRGKISVVTDIVKSKEKNVPPRPPMAGCRKPRHSNEDVLYFCEQGRYAPPASAPVFELAAVGDEFYIIYLSGIKRGPRLFYAVARYDLQGFAEGN